MGANSFPKLKKLVLIGSEWTIVGASEMKCFRVNQNLPSILCAELQMIVSKQLPKGLSTCLWKAQ